MNIKINSANQADTIVVGGGIAGLYCAWRLLDSGKVSSVIVLEALDRFGGRLATSTVTVGKESVRVEEGGMRFVDRHVYLNWLLEQLGFDSSEIVDFGMGDENNRCHFRGKGFTRAALLNGNKWSEIYELRDEEKGKSPFEILNDVKNHIIEQNNCDPYDFNPSSPEEWQQFRCELNWRGELLFKWGFRPLLQDYGLSNECIQMLIDTGGFACPFDRGINAGAAFQLMANFPIDPKFKTLVKGYQEVPIRLHNRIHEKGGRVINRRPVLKLEENGNKVLLTTMTPDGSADIFESTNVVLALPRRPLQEIVNASPFLRNNFNLNQVLSSVEHMPLTKMNFHYSTKWWKNDFGIQHGPCFTDLPLAQVYFFDIPPNNESQYGALTIYSDSARGEYWRQLQRVGQPFLEKDVNMPPALTPCSQAVVEHAQAFLKILFETDNLPDPLFATIRAWGLEGVGEGDHLWAIGHNDRETLGSIWNPHSAVFVCGESFSDEQAWVEGALRSTEKVLQRGFDVGKVPFVLPS